MESRKINKPICILKSGFFGAFALISIYFIFIITSMWMIIPFVPHSVLSETISSPLEVVLLNAGIGFAAGIFSSRFFQMIKHQTALLFVSFVLTGASLGCWMLLLNKMQSQIEIPHELKLADYTQAILNIKLAPPPGNSYQLELKLPKINMLSNGIVASAYKFSGQICISNDNSPIASFPINSEKAWLTPSGFILTGGGLNTNMPPLNQFLQSQINYRIQISLNPQPPASASIWLYWLHEGVQP